MTGKAHIPAAKIAKTLLDVTGNALVSGNVGICASVFHLPNTMTTATETAVIRDHGPLRRMFERVRLVATARYRNPATIVSNGDPQSAHEHAHQL